jgi:hypothetical protein
MLTIINSLQTTSDAIGQEVGQLFWEYKEAISNQVSGLSTTVRITILNAKTRTKFDDISYFKELGLEFETDTREQS